MVNEPHGASVAGARVLVTGAYGLLGSWLTKALLDRRAEVVVLRRDVQPGSALVLEGTEPQCTVVHGDILDAALLERLVGEHEVDTVIHLAAQTIVGTANRSPRATFETNIRGTWNVLEACRLHDVSRTVVAASDKAYGPSDTLPYVEDLPLRARHPYDVSKAAADLITRSYWHTYGLPVAVTRLANIYGGGDQNRSRLIPEAVAAVLEGRAPVIRSDGSPERDLLYVEDAVGAYLALLDLLATGAGAGESFNAGSGQPRSVLEIVEELCRVAGAELRPDVRGEGVPEGEIDRQWVDSARLAAVTGWRARVDLPEGLARTLSWYRAHPLALGLIGAF
ncbi:MAG: NAD-dependent epimerase/dehydratase family protein [Actinobacteria bacterium]|nr:NAD-dependent epimerase/dehydratase family protein [Actinomycetota bacterium]